MGGQVEIPFHIRSGVGDAPPRRRINRQITGLAWLFVGIWSIGELSDLAYRRREESGPVVSSSPGQYCFVAERSIDETQAVLGVRFEPSNTQPDRLTRHNQASQRLLDLALFYEGRGMHSVPAAWPAYDSIVFDSGWAGGQLRRWFSRSTGVVFSDLRPVGFFERSWKNQSVPVQGCAVCHAGKALGVVVPGLGNKNIDPAMLAQSALNVHAATEWMDLVRGSPAGCGSLAEQSAAFCQLTADARLANQTQGMVSVSTIRSWFYQQAGRSVPGDVTPAAVKTPSLWGFQEKRASGLFCDGMGEGAAWLAAVELVAGQSPSAVRAYAATLSELEGVFDGLLPPAYPLAIDLNRAARGREHFQRHCRECHGDYVKDSQRLPIFAPPTFVEIDEIQTDPDRLSGNTAEFVALVDANPLSELMKIKAGYRHGYLAPRLEGIWARFPYLHNGSIPNIAALLSAARDRPRVFSLADAGESRRFDEESLGLTVPGRASEEESDLLARGQEGARDVYLVSRLGHSNQGHEFGIALNSDAKRDLIEYLKSL